MQSSHQAQSASSQTTCPSTIESAPAGQPGTQSPQWTHIRCVSGLWQ